MANVKQFRGTKEYKAMNKALKTYRALVIERDARESRAAQPDYELNGLVAAARKFYLESLKAFSSLTE